MNSTGKKSQGARGVPRPFDRQAGHAPQPRPAVAQPKAGAPAQGVRRPVAPPVYRPQSKPAGVQAKASVPTQSKSQRVAPPVYKPQPAPKVLQTKQTVGQQAAQSGQARRPAAPPVSGASRPARFPARADGTGRPAVANSGLVQAKRPVVISGVATSGARPSSHASPGNHPAGANRGVLQMYKVVAEENDLAGEGVRLHYHITYESTSLSRLHVTFTNAARVGGRRWQMVYRYQHNRDTWSGPHYANAGRPTAGEFSLANSRLSGLQDAAKGHWERHHAATLAARQSEAARIHLASEDRDVAFPALGAAAAPAVAAGAPIAVIAQSPPPAAT